MAELVSPHQVDQARPSELHVGPSFSHSISETHDHLLSKIVGNEDKEQPQNVPSTDIVEPRGDRPQHRSSALEDSLVAGKRIVSPYGDKDAKKALVQPEQLTMWNPLSLHRSILVTFIALSGAMTIALGLLYRFSVVNNGIGTQLTANHYSWTYGPTAGRSSLQP